MALRTLKGATQPFTIRLDLVEGGITTDFTVIWMVKKQTTDSDEEAVLTRRLSEGDLVIADDGQDSGVATLTGTLSPQETLELYNHRSGQNREVTFETEVRVITPAGKVQPRRFERLTISDTVIDQMVHDSAL